MSKKASSSYEQFSVCPLNPQDKIIGGVFDPHAPGIIPKEKVDFAMKWSIKAKGNDNSFDFGRIPFAQAVTNMYKGVKTLNNTEIHVVWKSHVPPAGGQDIVNISFLFTQYEGFENQLQVTHAHPTHLHMHHIFYPRNTCNLENNGILPWAIDIHVDGEEYKKDYVVADVYIRLKGYAQTVASYSEDRDSDLISLVPLDTPIQGMRLSKPRIGGTKWKVGAIKKGTSNEANVKKMMLLQELGVDLEGAHMMKAMKQLLAVIPMAALGKNPAPEIINLAGEAVNRILRNHC